MRPQRSAHVQRDPSASRLPPRARFLLCAALAAAAVLPAAVDAQQGVTVRGTVRGADSLPLRMAEVIAGDSISVRTDSAGRFTLTGLPPGDIELMVRRLGFVPVSVPMTLRAGRDRNLLIELQPFAYSLPRVLVSGKRRGLFGTVVAEGGKPIEGAEIDVVGSKTVVHTNPDGTFGIFGLDARTYYVVIRKENYHAARFAVTLPPDAGQEVRVEMDTLPTGMGAGARRLAMGTAAVEKLRMYELERRMILNRPYLVPREVMAQAGKSPGMQFVHRTLTDALPAGPSTATLGQPTSVTMNGQPVVASGASGSGTPAGAGDEDRATTANRLDAVNAKGSGCYFIDGVAAPSGDMAKALPGDWIETIEIVRRDMTWTLTLKVGGRLPTSRAEEPCQYFVNIILRK